MIMMMETSFFKRKREMCSEVSEGISHAENYVRIQHQRLLWMSTSYGALRYELCRSGGAAVMPQFGPDMLSSANFSIRYMCVARRACSEVSRVTAAKPFGIRMRFGNTPHLAGPARLYISSKIFTHSSGSAPGMFCMMRRKLRRSIHSIPSGADHRPFGTGDSRSKFAGRRLSFRTGLGVDEGWVFGGLVEDEGWVF